MASFRIQEFRGIDQSVSQNVLSQSFSPDACNMETENGDLAVAKGYVKHLPVAIPGTGRIWRMYLWHKGGDDLFLIAAGNNLYRFVPAEGGAPASWSIIYTYSETITSKTWDFEQTRIGEADYLIIANGQSQLVKWDGGASAETFGSGEKVYESTIASVGYNLTKATAVTYDEKTGIYTLTMPDGWTYAQGCRVAFMVTEAPIVATSVRIQVGEGLYTISEMPTWKVGNIVGLTLTGATTATQVVISKAASAVYSESGAVGTYTVVMEVTSPAWAYAANCEIAFVVSAIKSSDTITSIKVVIGSSTYTLSAVPDWKVNDIAVVKLTSTTAGAAQTVACPSSAVYADKNGTYHLTMPTGWNYEENCEIAFTAPSTIGSVGCILAEIGNSTRKLNYIPGWIGGDTAVMKLTGESTAEVSLTEYGVKTVVLTDAIGADWKQRALNVGVRLKDVTREVSEISEDRLTLTLKEPCTDELAVGDTAIVRGGVSDIHVNYVEMHFSRLFSAGDAEHPSRLYWSQPPGDIRTIEDWSMDDDASTAGGGHVEVGNTSGDGITGLCSLSNQLLIFKESSIYRLLGSSPDDFRVVQVNLKTERMHNTGLVKYGDVPFWLTRSGLYYHDGSNGKLSSSARKIRYILQGADLSTCKAVENRDRLYFTCNRGGSDYDDSIVVYNMVEQTYMLRDGFHVIDICSYNGTMYMVNENRYVYRFGEGSTYDGAAIDAYWVTPKTDMDLKGVEKQVRWIYLRGEGTFIIIKVRVGISEQSKRHIIPKDEEAVLEISLLNSGRTIQLRIENEAGSYFRLTGGVEIIFDGGGQG